MSGRYWDGCREPHPLPRQVMNWRRSRYGRPLLSAPRADPYLQLSRIRLVWGFLCQGCITPFLSRVVTPFFCSTRAASFFRPDRIFPSPARAAAVKDGASSAQIGRAHV